MSVTLNKWPLQSEWSKKIFKWIFPWRSEKKKKQPHKDHEEERSRQREQPLQRPKNLSSSENKHIEKQLAWG